MDKEQLAKLLMATFLEEMHDHIGKMNEELLALEKQQGKVENEETLNQLFRSAHSLKGASSAVNVDIVETACHQMEDILGDIRDGHREFGPQLISLLLKAVDGIEEIGVRLQSEQTIVDTPLHNLLPELKQAAEQTEAESEPESDAESEAEANTSSEEPTESEPAPENIPAVASEPTVVPPNESPTPTPQQPAASTTPSIKTNTKASPALTIRVPAEKLDSLLAQSGELLVARRRVEYRANDATQLSESMAALRKQWSELERPLRTMNDKASLRTADLFQQTSQEFQKLAKQLDQLASNMHVDSRLLGNTCDSLDNEVYRVRMLPFSQACGGLARVVRDIASSSGKQVDLVIEGEDVEVDRSVLEGLKDPLLHLVRNAVDHGVDMPEDRIAANKPATATVTVSAALRGGQVEVVVADDGRGFNLEKIRAKAKKLGMTPPEDDVEAAQLVFTPGFSTAAIVTDVSGRGVGLDVVQSEIEDLHGALDLSFTAGQGSRFSLIVPLTLTTIRCALVSEQGQTYAIPTSSVKQIVRFHPEDMRAIAGRDMLMLGKSPTPVASLGATLGVKENKHYEATKLLAVVLFIGEQQVAFLVDEVIAEQEVLVKNLGARIRRVKHVSGATLLPSGNVALVLNSPNVIRAALGEGKQIRIPIGDTTEKSSEQIRVLAVDDSLTTRTLLKSILEAASYDVSIAVDGEHAWRLLQESKFDIVVSDVDMPNMNGFELTETIRNSEHSALPVVLVTARGTDADKMRGIQVGANAYMVKSGFNQDDLLDVIGQLT